MGALTYAGVAAAVLVAALCVAGALGVAALERSARVALLVLEGVAVLLSVAFLGWMLRGHEPPSVITHVGYMVAAVGIIPLVALRPLPAEALEAGTEAAGDPEAEPTPPSLWVGAIASLVVAVVLWRLAVTA